MVGFIGRLRKPKSPVVLGSPERDGIVNQRATTTTRTPEITPPVLRNFSYPTNIGNRKTPSSTSASPSTWEQLGEICSFSPDVASRTRLDRTAGLEDPFFYTTDRTPYKQLADPDEIFKVDRHLTKSERLTVDRAKNVEKGGPKDKGTKIPRNHSISDHILSPKTKITARLKRSSLGHHKTSSAFDASRLLPRRPGTPERPMSSSGVPLIDTRLTQSTSKNTKYITPPSFFLGHTIEGTLVDLERSSNVSSTLSGPYTAEMGTDNSKDGSPRQHHLSFNSEALSGDQRCTSELRKGKEKERKSRWFSHLKDWISISEPSTEALKNYKKDTFKKAGIAPNDPLANAKLHLPVASIPRDAIKPGGRGPEPEEIALQKAKHRKEASGLLAVAGTSRGSRSSSGLYSSSSSITESTLSKGWQPK
ncbi:hypothetical protein F4860DRAFT_525989 [Xylaria cubensis]|nr:hypothetical protein F4860DRAFT_525989 [Xylaria cubensis]